MNPESKPSGTVSAGILALKRYVMLSKRQREMRQRADALAEKWRAKAKRVDSFEWRVYEHWWAVGSRTLQ